MAIRALAHPLRHDLMSIIGRLGQATTADAARELGISHGLASHHLRQLAKYGFVEQVKGKDHRERPWRMVATSYNWAGATATAEGSHAVDVLEQVFAEQALDDFLKWQQRRKDWPAGWQGPAGLGQSTVYLTQAELAGIAEAVDALLVRYIDERPLDDVASRPAGSVPVSFTPCSRCPEESRPVRRSGPRRRKADMRETWRMLRGRRDLRLVLSAGVISLSGDWILTIGLIYHVYAVTGSTVASALTMASSFAPQVLLGAVAGVFADRWDRSRTMIVTDLLLAAGLLPLLLVHSAAQVWIVFAVMFAEGAIQQFFSPAEQAMVPRLVADEELLAVNALNGQVSNVSRLAGSALGGILAAAGGIVAVTLIDAGSFVASAAFLSLVRTSGRMAPRGPSGASVRAKLTLVGTELRDGLRLSTRNKVLRALMIFALVTSVGEGIMSTLFTPFVEHVLHGSPQDLGFIVAAQAVGGIAGGMFAAASSRRLRASRLLCYGAIVFGLIDLAIFLYPIGFVAVWPAIVGMIIVGLPGALTLAGLITLFQRNSDDSCRGRVFGAISAVEGVTVLAGTLGAGYLSRAVGIIPVLAIQGGGYVVAGLVMLIWLTDSAGPPAAAGEDGQAGDLDGEPVEQASLAQEMPAIT